MANKDTLQLLKACESGIHMALTALEEVGQHVHLPQLQQILDAAGQQHRLLQRECGVLLEKSGRPQRELNPALRKMAVMKISMKLGMDRTDSAAATVVAEGCQMGVLSLYRELNGCPGAHMPARALCRTLCAIEEQLIRDMGRFL